MGYLMCGVLEFRFLGSRWLVRIFQVLGLGYDKVGLLPRRCLELEC